MKIHKVVTVYLDSEDMTKAIMAYLEQKIDAKITYIQISVNTELNDPNNIQTFTAKLEIDGDAKLKEVLLENSSET
jgi:hypothetical protein